MMFGMAITFASLLVKGAATDASPSLMVGGSSSSSESSSIDMENFSAMALAAFWACCFFCSWGVASASVGAAYLAIALLAWFSS
jgi:hypothetical protein